MMTPMNALKQDWTTRCRCGAQSLDVEPEMVNEPYAVHLTITNMKAVGPGYTITHRPSGFALWHVREFDAAVRVAHWAVENLKLPATDLEVQAWKQNLDPVERMRIAEELTNIAPREWFV